MSSRLMRTTALAVLTTFSATGCLLSRAVDRAFIGITTPRPSFHDRKTTGIFLLPFTFVIDVATFPIQALLVVILGDNFPFHDADDVNTALASNETFQRLDESQRATALAELDQLVRTGQLTPDVALALGADGHWTLVRIDAEARAQLIARASQPAAAPALVCAR